MPLSRTMEQVKQDTYDGWTLVSVDDSGGVLLQSPTGKRRRVWFQTVEIERLEKKNDQLRAIVDKLPRTADGVVVVPRMDLYKRASHKDAEGLWNVVPRPRVDAIEANGIVRRHGHESGWLERASELYASRYAATGEAEQVDEQPITTGPPLAYQATGGAKWQHGDGWRYRPINAEAIRKQSLAVASMLCDLAAGMAAYGRGRGTWPDTSAEVHSTGVWLRKFAEELEEGDEVGESEPDEPQPDAPTPTCETCRFWWGRKIDGCGDCQRFPPTHDQDGLGVFPLNYAESWCGEHQPREDK